MMQNRTVAELIGEGLHMDFGRHVAKMIRIGRLTEGCRPKPLRASLKLVDGKEDMLARANRALKKTEK